MKQSDALLWIMKKMIINDNDPNNDDVKQSKAEVWESGQTSILILRGEPPISGHRQTQFVCYTIWEWLFENTK